MTAPSAPGKFRTAVPFSALLRNAILFLLIVTSVLSQTPHSRSDEDRAAEMKARVIETLNIRPGDTAADVGCGDGFYTIPLARSLGPSGKVFAVDINDIELFKLKQHLAEEGLKNVEIIKGLEDDPRLPADTLDGALIVNAYHEMSAHEAMLRYVLAALKQGAVLVVMEGIWDKDETKPRDEQIKHHELAPQVVRQEVEKAGFEIMELHDPFIERTPDKDGKSRWWILVARKPAP